MYKRFIIKIDLKYPTILIGIFHLIFLIFRIYEIAMDLYFLEELAEVNQLTYVTLITLLQLGIIISLFVGATKKQHVFLLPWLCFTAPTFCMATAYATLYVATGDSVQSIINYAFIVIFWSSWYLVFKYYIVLKNSFKYSPFKGYKYSANLKELNNECGESL
ncbi:hypothetical protein TcasGA2_TC032907 [Tribolium castaneum]|uniref:Uncharacterized protein n=1 Tax=Tribolium castaneum TaxID=7070 RepID=A0A139WK71_TRICA|nr:hypothetical protein TcasGA2_TC032907 [Tribolium castaneum]